MRDQVTRMESIRIEGYAATADEIASSEGAKCVAELQRKRPMTIMAIDPGTTESAWVIWDGQQIHYFAKAANKELISCIRHHNAVPGAINIVRRLVIEQVASFGMPVGAEVFETVFWSGRFAEAFGADRTERITRHQIKMHLCHNARAKDANIRQALIDRFGKVGTKKSPGPLYGISGDVWSALALAVTWTDTNARDIA